MSELDGWTVGARGTMGDGGARAGDAAGRVARATAHRWSRSAERQVGPYWRSRGNKGTWRENRQSKSTPVFGTHASAPIGCRSAHTAGTMWRGDGSDGGERAIAIATRWLALQSTLRERVSTAAGRSGHVRRCRAAMRLRTDAWWTIAGRWRAWTRVGASKQHQHPQICCTQCVVYMGVRVWTALNTVVPLWVAVAVIAIAVLPGTTLSVLQGRGEATLGSSDLRAMAERLAQTMRRLVG
jgi:hypothetical protein